MRLLLRCAPLALMLIPTVLVAGDDGPDAADIARKYASTDPEVRAEGEKVVAEAPAPLLRQVLASLRGSPVPHPDAIPLPPAGTRLVHVEMRFLEVLPAAGARLGIMDGAGMVRSGPLTANDLDRLLDAVELGTDVVQITAPSMTVYDRQKANVSVSNRISYVQDFRIESAESGDQVADPIVATVDDGLFVDLRPSASQDGKTVDCAMTITSIEVVSPIAEAKVRLATGTDATVQLPEVRTVKHGHRVVVPSGETIVLDAGDASFDRVPGGPRQIVAVLTVEVLDSSDIGPLEPIPR